MIKNCSINLLVGVFLVLLIGVFCLVPVNTAIAASYNTSINNTQQYTLINTITVSNPSNSEMKNVKVTLPLISKTDLGQWQVLLAEELNPVPVKVVVNKNNGRDATYNIGNIPAKSSVKIEQRFLINNSAINYNLNFQNYQYNVEDVAKIDKKYLQSEAGIDITDPAIIAYANSLAAGHTNPYLIAKALFSDINLFMTYDNTLTEHSASQAVRTGRGNCVDYSYLYIACLRSLGIPARIYTGYLYSPAQQVTPEFINADGTINMNNQKHNWVEFYVSGMGWIVADPTFTYYSGNYKSVDWSRFAEIGAKNRLISLYQGIDSASASYSGNVAPVVSYDTKLKLADDISPFYDLVGHWARDSVLALSNGSNPVVYGKTEHYFGVNDRITRAELVTMVNRVLAKKGITADSNVANVNFADVNDKYWAYPEIQKAVKLGYVVGFPDNTFKPTKNVSRAEMMSILNKVANVPDADGSPFIDLDMNGYKWAKSAIENCYNAGLAKGILYNEFQPQGFLTRGEAAVFIDRWIQSNYY